WEQARVAEFLCFAGEFVAILEIAELILHLDEFARKEEIFVGEVGGVVGDGVVPGFLFRSRVNGFSVGQRFRRRAGGLAGVVRRCSGLAKTGFAISRVMEIDT